MPILPAVSAELVEEVKPVQGKMPDSVEEWRVSIALDKRRLPYVFQYAVGGGSRVRGGTVIDFLVQTAPLPTPLFVDGAYWHRGNQRAEDELLRAKLVQVFRGAVRKPVSVAAGLLKDQASADTIIRQLFG